MQKRKGGCDLLLKIGRHPMNDQHDDYKGQKANYSSCKGYPEKCAGIRQYFLW